LTANPLVTMMISHTEKRAWQEEVIPVSPPKCDDLVYIHFLIASQKNFTCTEAERCQPESPNSPAHDAFTRLLQRQPLDTEALWQEAKAFVKKRRGFWFWMTPL